MQARDSLKKSSFDLYLKHYGIEIKRAELEDLKSLVEALYDLKENIRIFDEFYLGYKIPQIGKEFDLLRFGKESVINVELKSTSTEEKIQKQLVRNKYYLSYIGKTIFNLCYVSDTKSIYFLEGDESIDIVEVDYLRKLLIDQKIESIENIDNLFNPSDYLVSSFNSTQKFLSGQYFLTNQQEDVKKRILNSLGIAKSANFISVVGGAGTGKTLLVYDLVKELRENRKRPLVIHCGYLNEGHEELKKRGWEIIPIKVYNATYDLSDYDVIVIDEAQRIYPDQLEKVVEATNRVNGNCIFSYDKLQTLAKREEVRDINGKINNITPLTTYRLSEKIRTNKEIATFIVMLFNSKRKLDLSNKSNIEVNYFKNMDDAKNYLGLLDCEEWEVLRFTPSLYNNEHHEKYSEISKKTSHKVIGQEFDGVAVTIDKYFSYGEGGELVYGGQAYYSPVKMLFQNITRARKRVNLVIIDNEELLDRCMHILQ